MDVDIVELFVDGTAVTDRVELQLHEGVVEQNVLTVLMLTLSRSLSVSLFLKL
jgi:hypothetical protein